MANTLTPVDVYGLMNTIAKQALGATPLAVVDTSTFTAVGETLLRTSAENTLGALSTVLAKTIFSVRPYKGKLESLRVAQQRWGGQIRKVVNLMQEAEPSQDWNTDLNAKQLDNGNSIDMYKINKPKVMQLNFYGTKVLQKHITRFRDQLALAFTSETEFVRFIDSVMVEFANEVELLNESKTRATLINYIAGLKAMDDTQQIGNVVDLVAEFNANRGTAYTREELLGEHISEFMKFVASTIKIYSSALTDLTSRFHANITGHGLIMRHTPKQRQKMIMYEPLFVRAESEVYSTLFNPKYLDIGEFEGVNYWQSPLEPTKVSAVPNILNTADGKASTALETTVDYVLGALFDEEAIGVMPQFDYTSTTPFNSAGGYYNMFMHWRFNSYVDYTENGVLFILGAGGEATGA